MTAKENAVQIAGLFSSKQKKKKKKHKSDVIMAFPSGKICVLTNCSHSSVQLFSFFFERESNITKGVYTSINSSY